MKQGKPNLVFFIADQMRADSLAHLGNSASITPNIDKLAAEDSVSFSNAYCQNPVCVPSRCSFLTGWYPHTKGHRTMHYLLDEDDPMLLKILKKEGYHVRWIGRNDVIPSGMDMSDYCDEYYSGIEIKGKGDLEKVRQWEETWRGQPDADTYYSFFAGKQNSDVPFLSVDWNCINKALTFLDDYDSETEGPFCLYISLVFPHPPYCCEEPWFSMIDRSKIQDLIPKPENWEDKPEILRKISEKQGLSDWSNDRFTELRAVYLAMVARLDHQLGLILDKLKEKQMYDDSAIFMFSDHGDYTGDYGIVEKTQNTFEDCLTKIPLVIKPQKGIPCSPGVSRVMTELVDIPMTVCDLAGIELAHIQFGKSLTAVLGGKNTHRDYAFCEGGRIHGENQAMEGGHGPASLYWPRLSSQCSEGAEHTKAVMVTDGEYKFVERLYEKNELYNLRKDPGELTNLINDPDHQLIITNMKNRILTFYMETTDYVPDKKDKRV